MLDNRFWNKVDKIGCCWYWIGAKTYGGYGLFRYNGKSELVHRLSYEDAKGEIPDGLVINHICRNRHCVNPDHLEVITRGKNIQIGICANRNKTHCPQDHEYTEENTLIDRKGARVCRMCARIRNSQYRQREKTLNNFLTNY